MKLDDYVVVGNFSNDTTTDMRIFLEMTWEIFLSPGYAIELLAKKSDGLLPVTVAYVDDGLQIFANKEFDVDWHVRFDGKILKPGYPTRLPDPHSGQA